MISISSSYTAPTLDSINFSLCSGYTAPTFDSINFTLADNDACITDSCTYSSGDWIVDCADNCDITDAVNVGGNDIFILGTGTFRSSADISNYGEFTIEGTDSSNLCVVTIF